METRIEIIEEGIRSMETRTEGMETRLEIIDEEIKNKEIRRDHQKRA